MRHISKLHKSMVLSVNCNIRLFIYQILDFSQQRSICSTRIELTLMTSCEGVPNGRSSLSLTGMTQGAKHLCHNWDSNPDLTVRMPRKLTTSRAGRHPPNPHDACTCLELSNLQLY